ncbi:MAG: hypothetical protein M3335_07630 [Actinomycetota bacterium]|nr:hypothetical protein [Actinomycetota bacterium]
MTYRYLPLAVLLAALFALSAAIAGCGDSDSAEASLTKKQFIEQAEKICKQAENEQVKKINEYIQLQKRSKVKEKEFAEVAGLQPLEKEITRIKELGVPAGDEKSVSAFIRAFESSLDKARSNPKVLLEWKTNPFEETNELAKEYGLEACGNAP